MEVTVILSVSITVGSGWEESGGVQRRWAGSSQAYREPRKHTEGNFDSGIPRREKQGNRWLAVERVPPAKSKIWLLGASPPYWGLLALHKQSLPES